MRPLHALIIGLAGIAVVVFGSKLLFPGDHDAQALFRLGCLAATVVALAVLGHHHISRRQP